MLGPPLCPPRRPSPRRTCVPGACLRDPPRLLASAYASMSLDPRSLVRDTATRERTSRTALWAAPQPRRGSRARAARRRRGPPCTCVDPPLRADPPTRRAVAAAAPRRASTDDPAAAPRVVSSPARRNARELAGLGHGHPHARQDCRTTITDGVPATRAGLDQIAASQPRRRRDSSPRNIRAAAAAAPRPVSREYLRRRRGVAAIRLHGTSAPRKYTSPPSALTALVRRSTGTLPFGFNKCFGTKSGARCG